MAGPDPTYNTANYRQIGGALWYINGELRIGPNGIITQDGVQAAALTPVVSTTPALTSYGFTLAQAEAIIANLNAVTAALAGAGLLA